MFSELVVEFESLQVCPSFSPRFFPSQPLRVSRVSAGLRAGSTGREEPRSALHLRALLDKDRGGDGSVNHRIRSHHRLRSIRSRFPLALAKSGRPSEAL